MVSDATKISYHGHYVGAVSFDTKTGLGSFQYDRSFIAKGIQLSPLMMPLSDRIYSFPALDYETFKGLPGLLADSLPDDFGNAVLNQWVAAQGRRPEDITPLERLQYTGKRGMGALEYAPAARIKGLNASTAVDIANLVSLAQNVLDQRNEFHLDLQNNGLADAEAMLSLLSIGMSAGGARPKAVLAFSNDFKHVRSGQATIPQGFTHYLMKFDGVSENSNRQQTFGDPLGYGAMEYTYSMMAKACGINMMPCKLLDEGNRRHFITQRFDRNGNEKIHVQTLNGLCHIDYKKPGTFSYAEIFDVARKLSLPLDDALDLLRRLVFNIVTRNHDDHPKNFAFIFNHNKWSLSPAYDLAYSFKPGSKWVNSHWMSLNGKRDNFTIKDFYSLESVSSVFNRKMIDDVVEKTIEVASTWKFLATHNEVPERLIDTVSDNLNLAF